MRSRRKPVSGSRAITSDIGLRAARQTSIARISLGVSFAWMRAAVAGSRRVSSRCRWSFPCFCCDWREAGAEIVLASGTGKEPFSKRAQVKARSTRDNGQPGSRRNLAQSSTGQTAVFARSEGLVGIGNINQVMRKTRAFFRGWLGGAQVHAAINGYRVATDDLAAESLAERQRKRRLAGTRRPQNENHKRFLRGEAAFRRPQTRTHGRHQPGGKIHLGLVRKSVQTRIAAATSSKPNTWLRR